MNTYLGEVAALLTSFFWSGSSIFFTLAGRKYGSLVVNRIRLIFAAVFLILLNWAILGQPIPWNAGAERWFWMSLSGFVGLVLGDIFLFQSYLWVGPRLTMLMMSLSPVIGALSAWLFLGETLPLAKLFAILVTLSGIAWVIWDGNSKGGRARNPNYLRGIVFGVGAAAGQALGLVLSKKGMGTELSPIAGNVIRMIAATFLLWAITLFQGQGGATLKQIRQTPRALWLVMGGAICGPFVGVSFSLYAVQHADVGVASTLMALSPVVLLPVSYFFFKERFGWSAVVATMIAISGVALLFLL